MNRVLSKKNLLIFLMATGFASCAVHRKASSVITLRHSYCIPPTYFVRQLDSTYNSVLPGSAAASEKVFTRQNMLLIQVLGISPEVEQLLTVKDDTSLHGRVLILELRNRISNTLLLAISDINAAASELGCEAERVRQVAAYIDDLNSSRNNKLVVSSIALGAGVSIAGALVNSGNLNKAITIGGGIAGAGLGFLALSPKGKKTAFYHKRNILETVWQQKDPGAYFSPLIWFMINEKSFTNTGQTSLIQNLKERWIEYQFSGNQQKGDQSIVFTSGGSYLSADLHTRVTMINEIQAVILTLSQNINNLALEINLRTR